MNLQFETICEQLLNQRSHLASPCRIAQCGLDVVPLGVEPLRRSDKLEILDLVSISNEVAYGYIRRPKPAWPSVSKRTTGLLALVSANRDHVEFGARCCALSCRGKHDGLFGLLFDELAGKLRQQSAMLFRVTAPGNLLKDDRRRTRRRSRKLFAGPKSFGYFRVRNSNNSLEDAHAGACLCGFHK